MRSGTPTDQPWGRSPSCKGLCHQGREACECIPYEDAGGVDGKALGDVLQAGLAVAAVALCAAFVVWAQG